MLKLDHFYIKVTDLNKAIKFYQMILGKKISHKEGNRWADFDSNDGIYLGIFNATNDNETFKAGDNVTLALKTDDIQSEFERIKSLEPKKITDIVYLSQPYDYYYFQFEDNWGNTWEVTQYSNN